MQEIKNIKDNKIADPYVDRRSGEDRRQVYDTVYWESGGLERRSAEDRRRQKERRGNCVNVSEWSSVCPKVEADQ